MRKKIKLLSVILCVLALTGCNKSSQNELTISVATSLLNPINEIIKGKAPITTTTALKFEYVFNIPASFFNNLESSYQEVLEREEDFIRVKEEEKYLENIPYNEMAKRGWDCIEKTNDPFQKVINLRKSTPALYNGDFKAIEANNNSIMAYERNKDDSKVYVIHNFSEKEQQVTVENIDGMKVEYSRSGKDSIKGNKLKIKPLSSVVISKK